MIDNGPALIWCPFADAESAEAAARTLLDEGLIACANLLPGMRSFYTWNGERGESAECGMLIKTDKRRLDRAIARLEAIHPYETPAIVGWACDAATPATTAWLTGATGI